MAERVAQCKEGPGPKRVVALLNGLCCDTSQVVDMLLLAADVKTSDTKDMEKRGAAVYFRGCERHANRHMVVRGSRRCSSGDCNNCQVGQRDEVPLRAEHLLRGADD